MQYLKQTRAVFLPQNKYEKTTKFHTVMRDFDFRKVEVFLIFQPPEPT